MRTSRKLSYFEKMLQAKRNKGIVLKAATICALGFGLWACSSDPTNVSGGGPSGTEAGNAIIATIVNIDGSPAKLAKVTLVESNSLDGASNAYITNADENGNVVLDSINAGNYVMEASLEGDAMQIEVSITDRDSVKLGEQKLEKPVYIQGSLVNYGCKSCETANGTLKFYGLNHSTEVTNGEFSIGGLPAGTLKFAFIPSGTAEIDMMSFQAIKAKAGDSIVTKKPAAEKDTTSKVEPAPEKNDTLVTKDTLAAKDTVVAEKDTVAELETLLIDDFSDGDNIHNMGTSFANSLNSSGAWFLIPGDNKMGNGAISVEPKVSNYTNPFSDIIETDENSEKLVHFTLDFPDSQFQAYPPTYTDTAAFWSLYPSFKFMDSASWVGQWWTTFGIEVGATGTSYDFTNVDSIAFEIWGKGSCTFELIDENLKSTNNEYNASFYSNPKNFIIVTQEIKLQETKTRIAIAMDDLLPDAEKRKNISMISWVFHDDAELYFDNLVIIGRKLNEIWADK